MFKALLLLYVFHLITIFALGYIIWKRDEVIQSVLNKFIVAVRKEISLVKDNTIDKHSSEIVENAGNIINNLPFL